MNRCQVCDKTDEDDPKIGISLINNEALCLDCRTSISNNLEDLSINDEDQPIYLSVTDEVQSVLEADGKQIALSQSEVFEQ